MIDEHKVQCNICKEVFRPVESHIKLICKKCFEDATGKELIAEFLEEKTLIPLIAKIIEKETIEDYCTSEIIADLIYHALKKKWGEILNPDLLNCIVQEEDY